MAIVLSPQAASRLGLGRVEYDRKGRRVVTAKKESTRNADACIAAPKQNGKRARLVHAGGPVWRLDLD